MPTPLATDDSTDHLGSISENESDAHSTVVRAALCVSQNATCAEEDEAALTFIKNGWLCAGAYVKRETAREEASPSLLEVSSLLLFDQVDAAFNKLKDSDKRVGIAEINCIVVDGDFGQPGTIPQKEWLAKNLFEILQKFTDADIVMYPKVTEGYYRYYLQEMVNLQDLLDHNPKIIPIKPDNVLKLGVHFRPDQSIKATVKIIAETLNEIPDIKTDKDSSNASCRGESSITLEMDNSDGHLPPVSDHPYSLAASSTPQRKPSGKTEPQTVHDALPPSPEGPRMLASGTRSAFNATPPKESSYTPAVTATLTVPPVTEVKSNKFCGCWYTQAPTELLHTSISPASPPA
ncbi:MAG: hypothetical protein Q7V63_06625 [Gammaproteobacteria bacterium]|nr:hypothetical protein [Gammaproteobacteria bacterium]